MSRVVCYAVHSPKPRGSHSVWSVGIRPSAQACRDSAATCRTWHAHAKATTELFGSPWPQERSVPVWALLGADFRHATLGNTTFVFYEIPCCLIFLGANVTHTEILECNLWLANTLKFLKLDCVTGCFREDFRSLHPRRSSNTEFQNTKPVPVEFLPTDFS